MTPRGSFFTRSCLSVMQHTVDSRMLYRQATADDAWVDDPASPRYNQWVKGSSCHVSRMKKCVATDGFVSTGRSGWI